MSAPPHKDYSCIALTRPGARLAARLASGLAGGVDVYLPRRMAGENPPVEAAGYFDSLSGLMANIFHSYKGHIFIAAAGIAVRAAAPLLQGKSRDPAVAVCDQRGQFCISLLSGHYGGGNDLAARAAAVLGAVPVITTATDVEGLAAPDLLAGRAGCRILDWPEVKTVNAAILRGEQIALYDPCGALLAQIASPAPGPCASPRPAQNPAPETWPPHFRTAEAIPPAPQPAVAAHWRALPPRPGLLRLAVPALHVGLGCRRGTPAGEILAAVETSLVRAGLAPEAVAALASIEQKGDEAGLLQAARALGLPLKLFSAARLAEMPVKNPSPLASRLFGQPHLGVCEGAALASAWSEACPALLALEKTKYENVTVAAAVSILRMKPVSCHICSV